MPNRNSAMRRVLMTAFHFPPFHGSSGVQRTLKFVRYLPQLGWQPIVLSAWAPAYPETAKEQLSEVDAGTPVYRAWGLDAARHLAIGGKYLGWFERPDRWRTWSIAGAVVGRRIVTRHQPKVLWSTYPIPSAHAIAYGLQRRTGLPWIADFRDNMVDADYPASGPKRDLFERLEARWVQAAKRVVLTTERARELCRERHPREPAEKWVVIRNGYDEDNFVTVERELAAQPRPSHERLELVHSGLLQPSERDPSAFFEAVARLKAERVLDPQRISVVLRGSGHDELYRRHVAARGIADIVTLTPPVSHYAALAEMLTADGLLLFQGANCNHLVPAKLYEYLRAGRPILALTDAAGETARILRDCGVSWLADMSSASAIAATLRGFVDALLAGQPRSAASDAGRKFSRRAQAEELANLLSEVE